ncbi:MULTISPECIES: potassium-transporting ATPase subunit C [unclassified Rhodococcus (in: high G+C Gram-positive bacteria)]|uniref:potassium-transporting ATPase subunit C n=1 Tax=Rhodococcus sp. SJ-3 TaxID=3454628 RepID=UPI003F7982AD
MHTMNFLRQLRVGAVLLLMLTAAVGVGYPATVWAVSRLGIDSAEGAPLTDTNGCVVGSRLIGVDPQVAPGDPDPFFHLRMVGSVAEDDPFAPGDPAAALPSNQGPSSDILEMFIEERRATIAVREAVVAEEVPADAVTGSGSGVDPHISPDYAELQIPRVARVTGLNIDYVRELVSEHTEGRQFGFLGEERVNVPELNVALGLTSPGCTTGP